MGRSGKGRSGQGRSGKDVPEGTFRTGTFRKGRSGKDVPDRDVPEGTFRKGRSGKGVPEGGRSGYILFTLKYAESNVPLKWRISRPRNPKLMIFPEIESLGFTL